MNPNFTLAMDFYNKAFEYVEDNQLIDEVSWQRSRSFVDFSESELLQETAWVILCSGFREATIRRVFNHISLSFCDFESAASITRSATACKLTASASFKNVRKLDAIIEVARRVDNDGFEEIKSRVLQSPIAELQKFPFIGPVTAWHLAKNLGLSIAKPDRHLLKLSNWLGYGDDVHRLCNAISESSGELVSVVDLVLWRYMADITPGVAMKIEKNPSNFTFT